MAKQRVGGSPQIFLKKALLAVEHRNATHGCRVPPPIVPRKRGQLRKSPTLELKSMFGVLLFVLVTGQQQSGPTLKTLWVLKSPPPPPL